MVQDAGGVLVDAFNGRYGAEGLDEGCWDAPDWVTEDGFPLAASSACLLTLAAFFWRACARAYGSR